MSYRQRANAVGLPIIDGELAVRCVDCSFSRKCGAARFQAARLARRHAHANPEHTVLITRTEIVEEWKGYTPKLVGDEPPF